MKSNLNKTLLLTACSIILFFISKYSKVSHYTQGDPQLTLLTAQSLLEHGNTNLFTYYEKAKPGEFSDGTWKYSVKLKEKEVRYFYPIGTSILCLPIVGIARLLGYDFINLQDDALWQSLIASICVSVIFLLLFRLASFYMVYHYALMIAILMCLGTTIISTIGIALWSFNLEIILLLLSFIQLSKFYKNGKSVNGIQLGVLVYLAWLCRPSAMVVIAIFAVWLFLNDKQSLKKYLITIIALFIPFAIYAKITFGIIVPPYYHPLFWTHKLSTDVFLNKFFAVLFSPARGLFLFTPVLILPFNGLFLKEVRKNPLYIMSIIWFVFHTVMLARQFSWWGGWSFGPRLFSDALIPLFMMFLLTFEKMKTQKASQRLIVLFAILSVPGIFIHAIKGANDVQTYKWNNLPQIDEHTDFYTWNFSYPQFLADSISNDKKYVEFDSRQQLMSGLFKLKAGDHVFLKYDNPQACDIIKKLNGDKDFAHLKLHCHLDDLQYQPLDSFYIGQSLYQIFATDTNYIFKIPALTNLASYLERHKAEHVFLAAKSELLGKMSEATKEVFKNMNAQIFKLAKSQPMVMHIYNGKIVQESGSSKKAPAFEYTIAEQNVSVKVADNVIASIKVEGIEYSINDVGFNIVCVNDDGKVVDVARFNTEKADAEYIYFFKVIKKSSQLSK
jgi:hypothetical protein